MINEKIVPMSPYGFRFPTEDDLIKKEMVIDILQELYIPNPVSPINVAWDNVIDVAKRRINELPLHAIDVVRCKDCKHFDGECCDRYADETLGYSHSTQPNFFCACGERKTDVQS